MGVSENWGYLILGGRGGLGYKGSFKGFYGF